MIMTTTTTSSSHHHHHHHQSNMMIHEEEELLHIPKYTFSGRRNATMISLGEVIGSGAFATVRKGSLIRPTRPSPHRLIESTTITCTRPRDDGTSTYAIKCVHKDRPESSEEFLASIDREVSILKKCSSVRFVAKMFFNLDTESIRYIGLEYCAGGDLYSLLTTSGTTHSEAVLYLAQIASALSNLHLLNIVYHDLKPENICLDQDGNVKLVDFGMAYMLDDSNYNEESGRQELVTAGGTFEYSAPEIFWRLPHSFEADWWSYGVIAYEMLCGELPYYIEGTVEEQCAYICSPADFNRNDIISPESCEESFLSLFLVKDAKLRFGYEGVDLTPLQMHEFFHGIDWSSLGTPIS